MVGKEQSEGVTGTDEGKRNKRAGVVFGREGLAIWREQEGKERG